LAAREDFAKKKVPFTYLNVQKDRQAMARMLEVSNGARQVPVIVEDGNVSIGFGGT
jgi:glutaredoxin